MASDPAAQKRALRAEIRERRRNMPSSQRERANAAIGEHLVRLAEGLGATYVAAYLPTPQEPSTRPFLDWALQEGVRVLLPISRPDGLLDWAPYDGADEDLDLLGMPQPTTELLSPLAINDVDLIIVPAAAVDAKGMRMGWGRGYYDRTLGSIEGCPPVYAVLFDSEIVDAVPVEPQDEPVDGAVTPSGTVTFPVA
ncbi:MAG: 5-formyltetrahydrofolate cyclo-ligase [Microbacteriaceae bacterium]|nr:5-formyltetrahydrofolate cyclo-ligase [Microbacteriaceae bacterium]